jgi:hypothetical protein
MAQLPSQSQFGDYGDWPGRDVLDSGGERLGGVREIYLDRETGRPEWVLVDVEGDEARFVPLADASVEDLKIRVAHSAATIRNAPGIGTEPRIDQSEERRLYDHYGIGYSTDESASGLPAEEPEPEPEPEPTTSSWSDAAKEDEPTAVAPAPAEPPSVEEIERAEIAEPPAVSPAPAGPSAEPDELVTPAASQPEPVPPPESELISPAATSEAPEVFTPPPAPEPEPVAPPPPPPAEPPRPEADERDSGVLETVKSPKTGVIAGLAIAAVLLLIIRRLR